MVIRDPIHGDIPLGPEAAGVLNAAEVQRLRGIKQTGTACLVYPGAVHTRFDHCLGTYATARRILARLAERGFAVEPEEARAVLLSALIHDVTHVPFGHTLEDERRLFPRHDEGGRLAVFLAGELGEALERAGCREAVVAILEGKGPGASRLVRPWMAQVVSSTIDADLLDYLRRDSYFAGLSCGYDDRIYRYFTLEGENLALDLARNSMERLDARSEALQLLRSRYFLTERVYFHHTKVVSGAMVAKAVELGLSYGLGEEALLWLDDGSMLRMLQDYPAGRPDPRMARLAAGVARRRLLKRGYVISAARVSRPERAALVEAYHADATRRRSLEEALARHLGLGQEDVIVYCAGLSVMKEAGVLVRTGSGVAPLNDPSLGTPAELGVLEDQYESLWRFYVFVPRGYEARCARAAEGLLGYPSEYEPKAATV